MKSLIVFDLDGTLAESKAAIDAEMSTLLGKLMRVIQVAIISGGGFPQFQKQVIDRLAPDAGLDSLSLLPTTGTKFYEHRGDWRKLYSEDLSGDQKAKIIDSLEKAIAQTGLKPQRIWGEQIEDRGSQITYSALGQEAPLEEKAAWDPDFAKRKQIKSILDPMLADFSVRLGGATSIDVTLPGIDKGYGIRKLRDVLGIPIAKMLFIGDAIFPGGNDYPACQAGAECIKVRDPEETKRVVEAIIACVN